MRWKVRGCAAAMALAGLHGAVHAQLIVEDKLNGATTQLQWVPSGGACLTAGDGTANSIRPCVGNNYYKNKNSVLVGGVNGRLGAASGEPTPDPIGQGALRLTNGDNGSGGNGDNQAGGVISNFTFPSNQGIQVTFGTVTYGGDGGTGADGISFFLVDGGDDPGKVNANAKRSDGSANVGGLGGSLGYSCSNGNSTTDPSDSSKLIGFEGVAGAYIGIGIDEYGNFGNPGDNTNDGPGFRPGRVVLRGGGNVHWAWLNSKYPGAYPSSWTQDQRRGAVWATCRTGTVLNSGTKVADYKVLAYSDLPSGTSISNQQMTSTPTRGKAIPITYSLKITQAGRATLSYSINGGTPQPVLTDTDITANNEVPMPKNFGFGFTAGTGGANNVHEITCFKAAPAQQTTSSVGANAQQSSRVQAGAQIYTGLYTPNNWWGQLLALGLTVTASDDISINSVANWDANCPLTGGVCQATGGVTLTATDPATRVLMTSSGGVGVPFTWSTLGATGQTALQSSDVANYLRGQRGKEVASGGSFRTRTGVLGDLIHSGPTWVGPPRSGLPDTWVDALYPATPAVENTGMAYSAFQAARGQRQNVVYVGANDGFLHGFRSGTGSYDGLGNFIQAPGATNDGNEVLGYMPSLALATIHPPSAASLDFASPSYAHNDYVDATPGTGDLFYQGAWHTWLVGGLGAGGNVGGPIANTSSTAAGNVFALDVTDPSQFSEAKAASIVVGDWTSATLACANATGCGSHLGSVYGTPVITRLHNGNWAVVFGNGLNSASGTAGLFILLVDSAGVKSFRYLDTGVGASGAKNGIVEVTPVDLDGDHVTDLVYAGDVNGNLWRFDLTGSDPSQWSVRSTPIFKTASGQPITTKVLFSLIAPMASEGGAGRPRVLLSFGTGKALPQTQTSAAANATGAQALYGVWDADMSAWNLNAAVKLGALIPAPAALSPSQLVAQRVTATVPATSTGKSYESLSSFTVCWAGTTGCTGGAAQYGWTLPLPGAAEQVVYNPVLVSGLFIVNTTIPGSVQPISCSEQAPTGFTMAIDVASGGARTLSVFGDGLLGNYSAIGLSGTGTPFIVRTASKTILITNTLGGTPVPTQVHLPGSKSGRVSWRQIK